MSVLSIPRIFFKGCSSWNPATMNNNDQWPTYDFVNAQLNWPYLASQTPPITPENATYSFAPWARTLQYYESSPTGWYQPPGEWNYYGGNEFTLHTATGQTLVTGGQDAYGAPVITDDSLVGAIVEVVGDPFPTTTFPTACRLVDTNPAAFWSTSFFVRSVLIGDQSGASRWLSGDVVPGSLMSSRWMNVQRNLNLDGELEIAGVAGVVLQGCLPNDTLDIDSGDSALLLALDTARSQPGVAGIMVRFSVYMTRYFSGSEFTGCIGMTDQYRRLVSLWDNDLAAGRVPTANPAVSTVVGTFGLWMDDELVSMPGGRYLAPVNSLTVIGPSPPASAPMAPAVAEVNPDAGVISLDLGATIPELNQTGAKADFGTLRLVVQSNGEQATLGSLEPADYGQASYEATAGIIDFTLPSGITPQDVAAGTLLLVAPGLTKGLPQIIALEEVPATAQTDARATWLDEGEMASISLQVRYKGAVPTQTINVALAQYLPNPPPPAANAGSWMLGTPATNPIAFANAPGNTIVVPPSAGGVAELAFTPVSPGFPAIAFFAYPQGQTPPVPPPAILPVLTPGAPLTIISVPYATVRVMPFDSELPGEFASLWTNTHDPAAAWAFVYANILGLYDLLFPIMRYYGALNLGSQPVVDDNIDLILELTDVAMQASSVYMPVTRDLSTGKRTVLQMYGWLVNNQWPAGPIDIPSAAGASGVGLR